MKTIAMTTDRILMQQMERICSDGVDLIPAAQSFDDLIKHLQIAMPPPARAMAADEVEIGQVLGRKKVFHYTDDSGADWRHKTTVEKSRPPHDELPQALLIDGERAAPPEDCGSIYGYARILDAKKHPRRAENRDYCEEFRYDKLAVFKIARAQKRLKSLFDGQHPHLARALWHK
jgi:hypothetical protein